MLQTTFDDIEAYLPEGFRLANKITYAMTDDEDTFLFGTNWSSKDDNATFAKCSLVKRTA